LAESPFIGRALVYTGYRNNLNDDIELQITIPCSLDCKPSDTEQGVKLMKIKDLASFRYSITNLPNDSSTRFAVPMTSTLLMATTYEKLIQHHIERLTESSNSVSSAQVARNHMTAISAFLRTIGKGVSSPIGSELTVDFDAQVKRHLQAAGLSERSSLDRKSLLNGWRNSYLAFAEPQCQESKTMRRKAVQVPIERNPFEAALSDGLAKAKLAPKTAARLARTSTSAISRWTRGALPNATTAPSLVRLNETLGLSPGTLLEAYHQAVGRYDAKPVDAYRLRLNKNSELIYRLQKRDASTELLAEWSAYFKYKTDKFELNIKRPAYARWTTVDASQSTLRPVQMWSQGNRVCPSANIGWLQLSQYLGFLRLPVSSGGYGLSGEMIQTIAWLAVPDAIDAFMTFQKNRSDGLVHGAQKGFATTVMSLVHPVHGYLTQCPYFRSKLPDSVTGGCTWEQMCAAARQVSASWKAEVGGKSREPSTPIQALLDLEQPAAPIFAAMRKIRSIGNRAGAGTLQEALARRDELLLGILMSNPLRCKNLVTMTYRSDNLGNVYQSGNGRWRIRLGGGGFKNRGRVGGQIYDVPVASWLEPLLSDYVKYFRPTLMNGKQVENLFLTCFGNRLITLSSQVARLTKRFIPGCAGFRPHAFRHLVATDWLTKHPNDFLTVAELLNDTIDVVMKNYAHMKKDIAFNRYETYIQSVLSTKSTS
jgi:hypothetical protein